MSSRKFNTSDPFDRYLGPLYKNWMRQSVVPLDARGKLMQAAAEAVQQPQDSRLFDLIGTMPSLLSVSRLMAILFPDPAENTARTAHLFRQNAFLPQHRGSLAFLNLV